MWNSKFGRKNILPTVVNGEANDKLIANNFATHFLKTCSINSKEKNDSFTKKLLHDFNCYVGDDVGIDKTINVEIIDKIINELKLGKAAGLDSISAEHLKYAHPIITSVLSMLFDLMLKVNYVPDAFGMGMVIPIPKHESRRKGLSSDDFRGITISPVISKVFENCLLVMMKPYMETSEFQFGVKKKFGCSNTIYTVRATVDHFTNNNATVNMCSLDLSKAFDKINHSALFLKLMERGLPKKLILILQCWYNKLFSVIKWKNCLSDPFHITAGVRQGGILSPHLFAVFVDDVLLKL